MSSATPTTLEDNRRVSIDLPDPSKNESKPISNKTVISSDEGSSLNTTIAKASESCHIKEKYFDISKEIPGISNQPKMSKTTASNVKNSSRMKRKHDISAFKTNTSITPQPASDVQKYTNIATETNKLNIAYSSVSPTIEPSLADHSKCLPGTSKNKTQEKNRRSSKDTSLKKYFPKSKVKTSKKYRHTSNLKEKLNSLNLTESKSTKNKTTASAKSSSNAPIATEPSLADNSKSVLGTSKAEVLISERSIRSPSKNKQTKAVLKPTKAKPKLPVSLPLVCYGTMKKDCHTSKDTFKEELYPSMKLHGPSKDKFKHTITKSTASSGAESSSNVLITEILETEPSNIQITSKTDAPGSITNTSSLAYSSARDNVELSFADLPKFLFGTSKAATMKLNHQTSTDTLKEKLSASNLTDPSKNDSKPITIKTAELSGAGSSSNVLVTKEPSLADGSKSLPGTLKTEALKVKLKLPVSLPLKYYGPMKNNSYTSKNILNDVFNLPMDLQGPSKNQSKPTTINTAASNGTGKSSNVLITEALETEPSNISNALKTATSNHAKSPSASDVQACTIMGSETNTSCIACSSGSATVDQTKSLLRTSKHTLRKGLIPAMDLQVPSKIESHTTTKTAASSGTGSSSNKLLTIVSETGSSNIMSTNMCIACSSASITVESTFADPSKCSPGTSKDGILKIDSRTSKSTFNEKRNPSTDLIGPSKDKSKLTTIRTAASSGAGSSSNAPITIEPSLADRSKSLPGTSKTECLKSEHSICSPKDDEHTKTVLEPKKIKPTLPVSLPLVYYGTMKRKRLTPKYRLNEELNPSVDLHGPSQNESIPRTINIAATSGAGSSSNAVISEALETKPSNSMNQSKITASTHVPSSPASDVQARTDIGYETKTSSTTKFKPTFADPSKSLTGTSKPKTLKTDRISIDTLNEEFNRYMHLHDPSKKESKITKNKTASNGAESSSNAMLYEASETEPSKISTSDVASSSTKVESFFTDPSTSLPGTSKVKTLKKDFHTSMNTLNEEFNLFMDLHGRSKEFKPTTIINAASIDTQSLSNSSSKTNTSNSIT